MGLHLCTEQECPFLGQPTTRSCGCHKTDEQVLRERVAMLLEACRAFIDYRAKVFDAQMRGKLNEIPSGRIGEIVAAMESAITKAEGG